ncbi:hypothetical protein TSUD_366480 [Trifolium subterraneum]|uniref:Reverse transcriptase domain-containing protein n=1 Tax=Trifolium subterraneum TaxID=3900 RepID=A0A2Z6MQJ8_TRISU|nr:hypothetical protein TSUD_366480 [Trifolium subterraneum]
MRSAVDSSLFHGYKVSNNMSFHTLQFVDDTIIVGEGNWDNLWTIKTVLRSFEIVSGLKVNFHKSKLYGINIDEHFLSASSAFLHCEVESIPFRFLGIPVGSNPRRRATWSPIVDSMKRRLCAWNGRNLSIGGRVTLLNSVLSSLPLYFFSFYKAPVSVIKELVSIQRTFLWGGGMDNKKVCWVSWDRICGTKEKGGLGIKNLAHFNFSLLCKWKWRCLNETTTSWRDILLFRYGPFAANFLYGEGVEGLKHASIWWRDIWSLGGEGNGNWFGSNISSVLGDGKDIGFWKEKWLGMEPLRDLYPSLFLKTIQSNANVSSMGKWLNDSWSWKFVWSESLTEAEEADVGELRLLLEQVKPCRENKDRLRWIPNTIGLFSIKSAYPALQDRSTLPELDSNTLLALKKLWRNNVPSKVIIFGWYQPRKLFITKASS